MFPAPCQSGIPGQLLLQDIALLPQGRHSRLHVARLRARPPGGTGQGQPAAGLNILQALVQRQVPAPVIAAGLAGYRNGQHVVGAASGHLLLVRIGQDHVMGQIGLVGIRQETAQVR